MFHGLVCKTTHGLGHLRHIWYMQNSQWELRLDLLHHFSSSSKLSHIHPCLSGKRLTCGRKQEKKMWSCSDLTSLEASDIFSFQILGQKRPPTLKAIFHYSLLGLAGAAQPATAQLGWFLFPSQECRFGLSITKWREKSMISDSSGWIYRNMP